MRAECAKCHKVELARPMTAGGEEVWKAPVGWTTVIKGSRVALLCRECATFDAPAPRVTTRRPRRRRGDARALRVIRAQPHRALVCC